MAFSKNEKEIDLHIEELVRDFSGMANAEMLQVQMSRFSKEMDAAISRHYKKIIFIHGVGNGKLKNEIRKELRNYQGVAFRDADNRKYGSGATEVIFE
jgi:dsDNA-specific endonuclease/ATPase MutS2